MIVNDGIIGEIVWAERGGTDIEGNKDRIINMIAQSITEENMEHFYKQCKDCPHFDYAYSDYLGRCDKEVEGHQDDHIYEKAKPPVWCPLMEEKENGKNEGKN